MIANVALPSDFKTGSLMALIVLGVVVVALAWLYFRATRLGSAHFTACTPAFNRYLKSMGGLRRWQPSTEK